jgi:tRNA (cmo5U34)-methyltransferase
MDDLGDGIKAGNANWRFDGDVVEQFEAHVRKSVPLYEEGHLLIEKLSDYFIKEDSICYELGSSTGKLIHRLADRHDFRDARFIGIEKEEDMVKKAASLYQKANLSFEHADITTYSYEQADLIVAYYTVQFIHPKLRQQLIDTLYEKLHWGGAFIMFEKVRANDARFQDILTGLYTDYKLEQGYTPDEIVAKSRSLKGVLEPFSTEGNIDMLKRAGFVDIITIQKYINFEGFLAIK